MSPRVDRRVGARTGGGAHELGHRLRPVVLALLTAGAGCGWFGGDGIVDPREPRVDELVDALPALTVPPPRHERPDRAEVMAAYDRIYGRLPDRRQNHSVGKRLADLSMGVGEERDIAGDAAPYEAAIALYESLLDTPDGDAQDEILYQLARAHDLAGRSERSLAYLNRLIDEYPDSRYRVEARFRRAELHFSAERWAEASADYGVVVAAGPESPYWQNANYMRGWSQFKRAELGPSLDSFFTVIAGLVGPAGEAGGDAAALPPTERELLEDSLRVVTLALGYLEGAATLAEQMAALQRPAWQYLVYQALADDYLARERYLDSVATWQAFIEQNPLDPRAPRAHLGMIDTLVAADFPSEVPAKKEAFVRRYGIRSEFWAVHDQAVRQTYLESLQSFLEELARRSHAVAQAEPSAAGYRTAARWYEELIETFPADPDTPEYLFLLGEVYTEAGAPEPAVAAYQRMAREFPEHPNAHEAGYAAILGLEQLSAAAPPQAQSRWQRALIDAQIEFALVFPDDPRAPAVQTDAADGWFALGEHAAAVDLVEHLLASWPELPWELRRTALLVQGHGQFELGRFQAAEAAYAALLAGPVGDAERSAVTERLLAAVYKQGEAAEQAGQPEQAVAHYLRLSEVAPAAELAVQGHYDAIAVTEAAGQPARAAELLAAFRERHPQHPLARDAGKRLAALYEQTGAGRAAADEYARLAADDPDPEVRRQSLYRAAELYLAEQDLAAAIEHFRDYAHRYEQPAEQRLEAVHQLDQLYQRTNDPGKRRFWLAKKIEIHRAMGARPTERATFLAAEAGYVLAEDARQDFQAIRLTHPLEQSLARKQQALERAVRAFEAVAAYQVAELVTASTYEIASLFSELAEAVMESDRPQGLSELEQAQYEILLEEQAFPFEEQAIALHEINMRRSWEGLWDPWIEKSFAALRALMPARFDKQEREVAYVESIH